MTWCRVTSHSARKSSAIAMGPRGVMKTRLDSHDCERAVPFLTLFDTYELERRWLVGRQV
jgi:hypothetical protein